MERKYNPGLELSEHDERIHEEMTKPLEGVTFDGRVVKVGVEAIPTGENSFRYEIVDEDRQTLGKTMTEERRGRNPF